MAIGTKGLVNKEVLRGVIRSVEAENHINQIFRLNTSVEWISRENAFYRLHFEDCKAISIRKILSMIRLTPSHSMHE